MPRILKGPIHFTASFCEGRVFESFSTKVKAYPLLRSEAWARMSVMKLLVFVLSSVVST
jgi:hypothetical protein